MSIPLDRLYHYIEHVAEEVRGNHVIIYRFSPHGSKKIEDFGPVRMTPWLETKLNPIIYCHDQEPLYYDKEIIESPLELPYAPANGFRNYTMGVYDRPLLIHSEERSKDLELFSKDEFIPVYFWSHAIIALDWFRFARHQPRVPNVKNKFLIYNRAWSGTREYRLKFADLLIDRGLNQYCQMGFNPIDPESQIHYQHYSYKNPAWIPTHQLENYYPLNTSASHYSADFMIEDYNSTDFEIVLETLFDDDRLHLTEKTLRPLMCGQAFILCATHGSLEYLRRYGFKTFDSVIDESYDNIKDNHQRMIKIIEAMETIAGWTDQQRQSAIEKITPIIEYNRRWALSEDFFNLVVDELKTNLQSAFEIQENTNTAARLIESRRDIAQYSHYRDTMLGKIQPEREDWAKTKDDIIKVLLKARQYYNKYQHSRDRSINKNWIVRNQSNQ